MRRCYAFPNLCAGSHVHRLNPLAWLWCLVVGHEGHGHGGRFGWDCQRCGKHY